MRVPEKQQPGVLKILFGNLPVISKATHSTGHTLGRFWNGLVHKQGVRPRYDSRAPLKSVVDDFRTCGHI